MEAYFYWLAKRHELSCGVRERLLQTAGSAENLYNMKKEHLRAINWLTEQEKRILCQAKEEEPRREFEAFAEGGGRFTCVGRPDYPERLRPLAGRPFALFYYGRFPSRETMSVAIVGARKCTAYGRAAARSFAEAAAAAGAVVVSGMAAGIDSEAQMAALQAGGESIGVLGCGIDVCYPASSAELYWRLRREGLVLSEYPPGTPALPWHFPARNRIISGLCDRLLVVEAKEKSGSLITADLALEQGRDVFAVPGRVSDALSAGCNGLIRQGAGIAVSPQSLLADMGLCVLRKVNKCKKSENTLANEEKLLYSCVDLRPQSLDELLEASGFSAERTMELLLNLQLKGYITEASRNHYVRTSL